MLKLVLPLLCLAFAPTAIGDDIPSVTLERVTDSVYSAIGATQPPTYENWGHNNNLSVVIGGDGVLVVNGGDNYLLAEALHAQVRLLTDLPVRWVVNENGQGHAFLGNSYWVGQDVPVIAHEEAVHEIEERGRTVLAAMQERLHERARLTTVAVPARSFSNRMSLDLGDLTVELISFGKAHSPGDISVWVPAESVLIAGDIAFHERLLGIFPDTDVLAWLASFKAMRALEPAVVVPGHGRPTVMAEIERYTYDYLAYLVAEVEKILDADGDLTEAYAIDQSAYAHLNTFEELAVKNAGRVFQQLELEFF